MTNQNILNHIKILKQTYINLKKLDKSKPITDIALYVVFDEAKFKDYLAYSAELSKISNINSTTIISTTKTILQQYNPIGNNIPYNFAVVIKYDSVADALKSVKSHICDSTYLQLYDESILLTLDNFV